MCKKVIIKWTIEAILHGKSQNWSHISQFLIKIEIIKLIINTIQVRQVGSIKFYLLIVHADCWYQVKGRCRQKYQQSLDEEDISII